MKATIYLVIYCACLSFVWGQSTPELRDLLRQEGGYAKVAKLVKDSPEPEQQVLLANVVKLVKDQLAKSPPESRNGVIHGAAAAFMMIGDEKAMLSAFREGLANATGAEQVAAAEALATCHSEDAVALVDQLARNHLGNLGMTLVVSPDEDERRARNDLLGTFVQLLTRLSTSVNPSGRVRAKKLRDEFAALYTTDNGKIAVTLIDSELAKVSPVNPMEQAQIQLSFRQLGSPPRHRSHPQWM